MQIILVILTSYVNAFTCTKQKPDGDACTADDQCTSGWCFNFKCSAIPALGENCEHTLTCAPGLACSEWFKGVCEPLPKLGENCKLSKNGPVLCEVGLYCYSGYCEHPRGENAACSDDYRCGDGLHCSWTRKTKIASCKPSKPRGSSCTQFGECMSGLFCNQRSHKCMKYKVEGQRCYGGDCASEFDCLPTKNPIASSFKKRECQSLPSEGEHCNAKCQTGYYCN